MLPLGHPTLVLGLVVRLDTSNGVVRLDASGREERDWHRRPDSLLVVPLLVLSKQLIKDVRAYHENSRAHESSRGRPIGSRTDRQARAYDRGERRGTRWRRLRRATERPDSEVHGC